MAPWQLARRFEAIAFGWLGTAVADAQADPSHLRKLIEELCETGVDVAILSPGGVSDVYDQLRARPRGPGRLLYRRARGGDVRALFSELSSVGIGPALVLIVGHDFGDRHERGHADSCMLVEEAARATVVSVGPESNGLPASIIHHRGGPNGLLDLLRDQLRLHRERSVPRIDDDPAWIYEVVGFDHELEGARESLLSLADGRFGVAGAPFDARAGTTPRVLAGGTYSGRGAASELVQCPLWDRSLEELGEKRVILRRLDLRSGVLMEDISVGREYRRTFRFSSLDKPGTMALRSEGSPDLVPRSSPLVAPPQAVQVEEGVADRRQWMRLRSSPGGVVTAAAEVRSAGPGLGRLERLATYVSNAGRPPSPKAALRMLAAAEAEGFDRLLRAHRKAWAQRWVDADIRIRGDPDLEFALRFALHHLIGSAGDSDETALGARGLSGTAYRGHVFWDSDVFVLPFLAATHPSAARAMLEYRIRRLPAAQASARACGRRGARFPWESASTGKDVTPPFMPGPGGKAATVLTGSLAEHIVADVVWSAQTYIDWTGDASFEAGPGRTLLLETARYWASRITVESDGRAHIRGVVGPDEYHEGVDDNAFTNVMARWNLRRAARLPGVRTGERERWRRLAARLVDGYDRRSGLYEQFAGFWKLEPLIIKNLAPRRPVAADFLLGLERTHRSQVIKQADVLMLHHLIPDSVVRGSLGPNLDFYEPRTAHGSSLSPGTHAALFARDGRLEEALENTRMTARLDLDDLTHTTAGGLHMAAMGSLWQAVVYGFAGVRPRGGGLSIDPHLPASWESLEIPIRHRGKRLRLRLEPETTTLQAEGALWLRFPDTPPIRARAGTSRYRRSGKAWKEIPA